LRRASEHSSDAFRLREPQGQREGLAAPRHWFTACLNGCVRARDMAEQQVVPRRVKQCHREVSCRTTRARQVASGRDWGTTEDHCGETPGVPERAGSHRGARAMRPGITRRCSGLAALAAELHSLCRGNGIWLFGDCLRDALRKTDRALPGSGNRIASVSGLPRRVTGLRHAFTDAFGRGTGPSSKWCRVASSGAIGRSRVTLQGRAMCPRDAIVEPLRTIAERPLGSGACGFKPRGTSNAPRHNTSLQRTRFARR
jgi:hypothetical protein